MKFKIKALLLIISLTLNFSPIKAILTKKGANLKESFLQTKAKVKIQTESDEYGEEMYKEYMKDSLSMKRIRKTKDGRACASRFVQNGVTYSDCTDSKSPDGKMTGILFLVS